MSCSYNISSLFSSWIYVYIVITDNQTHNLNQNLQTHTHQNFPSLHSRRFSKSLFTQFYKFCLWLRDNNKIRLTLYQALSLLVCCYSFCSSINFELVQNKKIIAHYKFQQHNQNHSLRSRNERKKGKFNNNNNKSKTRCGALKCFVPTHLIFLGIFHNKYK